MMRKLKQLSAGFTLLELMVALSIFAVISAMAYGGMNRVLAQSHGTEVQADKLKRMQKLYHLLERDFSQMINRKIRGAYGDDLDALVGNSQYDGVEFSHLGHVNPAGFLRSEIQRVRYKFEDGELVRSNWRVLDRVADSEPDDVKLLEDVEEFSVRYLTESDQWSDSWPPASSIGSASVVKLPIAVDVSLTTVELGKLNWYFQMPDAYEPGAGVASSSGHGSGPGSGSPGSGGQGPGNPGGGVDEH